MAFYRRRPRPDAEKCADPAKARASALETLAGQEVSANMLYERLCRRYTEQAAAAAVAEMVQLDYVNDARYAEARAHSLLAARKSRRAAAQSLRQKGLAPAEVAGALEAVYAPEDGDDPGWWTAATAKNWPSAAATLWWLPCSAAALPTPSSKKPSAGWRRNDPFSLTSFGSSPKGAPLAVPEALPLPQKAVPLRADFPRPGEDVA